MWNSLQLKEGEKRESSCRRNHVKQDSPGVEVVEAGKRGTVI